MWKKLFLEFLRLLLAALAGVGGASAAAGCSMIGHADNVYKTPCFERVSK